MMMIVITITSYAILIAMADLIYTLAMMMWANGDWDVCLPPECSWWAGAEKYL